MEKLDINITDSKNQLILPPLLNVSTEIEYNFNKESKILYGGIGGHPDGMINGESDIVATCYGIAEKINPIINNGKIINVNFQYDGHVKLVMNEVKIEIKENAVIMKAIKGMRFI